MDPQTQSAPLDELIADQQSGQGEKFGCCQRATLPIGTLILPVLYILDVVSDFYVAYGYYVKASEEEAYKSYYKLTLLLLFLPAPVLSIYNAWEYNNEYKMILPEERTNLPRISKWEWKLRIICTLLFLSRLLRKVSSWKYGLQYLIARIKRNKKDKKTYLQLWEAESRINQNLRLIEVFIESGPQLFLQLYITYYVPFETDVLKKKQLFSIITSVISLAWALATSGHLIKSLSSRRHVEEHTPLGLGLLFLAHMLGLFPRVLLLMLVITIQGFKLEHIVWASVAFHVLIMFLWFYFVVTQAQYISIDNRQQLFPSFSEFFLILLGAIVSLFAYIKNCDSLKLRCFYWMVCIAENTILFTVLVLDKIISLAIIAVVMTALSVVLFIGFHKLRHKLKLVASHQNGNASDGAVPM